jgi:hypothetical protein
MVFATGCEDGQGRGVAPLASLNRDWFDDDVAELAAVRQRTAVADAERERIAAAWRSVGMATPPAASMRYWLLSG